MLSGKVEIVKQGTRHWFRLGAESVTLQPSVDGLVLIRAALRIGAVGACMSHLKHVLDRPYTPSVTYELARDKLSKKLASPHLATISSSTQA